MENSNEARWMSEKAAELRKSGRIAIDRILEWDRGEREVSVAKVILADSASKSISSEP